MENKVDLSVILPAYNVEKEIEDSINSILSQSGILFEIIIVDDGSTDCTNDIIKRLADNNDIVHVYNQKNQGSGIARNTGLKYARGKYILFMDPDDTIASKMFATLKADFNAFSQEYDVILFSFNTVNGNKIIEKNHKLIKKNLRNHKEIMNNFEDLWNSTNVFAPWTKIINKNFILNNNLEFTNQRTGQDALFSLELFQKLQTMLWIPQNYYYYTKGRESSAQTKRRPEIVYDDLNILKKLKEFLENSQISIYSQEMIFNSVLSEVTFKELKHTVLPTDSYAEVKKTLEDSIFSDWLTRANTKRARLKNQALFLIRKNIFLAFLYIKIKNFK